MDERRKIYGEGNMRLKSIIRIPRQRDRQALVPAGVEPSILLLLQQKCRAETLNLICSPLVCFNVSFVSTYRLFQRICAAASEVSPAKEAAAAAAVASVSSRSSNVLEVSQVRITGHRGH